MLRLFCPLIALGLIFCLHHPFSGAQNPREDTWESILRDPLLTPQDHTVIEHLRPWLPAEDYLALDKAQRRQLLHYGANHFLEEMPVSRCWAPDTPMHVLLAFHVVEDAARTHKNSRKANQFFERWNRTATNGREGREQGRPITLTWSIVPDGTPVPGNPAIGDSDEPSSLRSWLGTLYGGDAGSPENQPWFPLIANLFDTIASQTGITYRYEPNDDGQAISGSNRGQTGTRGDLRLSGHPIDGDGATLAYNFFPDHGDMIIDTSDSFFENLSNNSRRLVNTIAHEHGHGLGLEHVCPIDQTKLLEPLISARFRGMQFDEIYTLQRWYGDPLEKHSDRRNNDSIQNACPIELAAGNPAEFQWLSIDDDADVDYYTFPLTAESQLTARVIPSNLIYPEGAEDEQGCRASANFDSSTLHDLSLALLDRNGQPLATMDSSPAGSAEALERFTVPEQGQYFLRIAGDDSDAAQLYRLELEVREPAVDLTLAEFGISNESNGPANGMVEPGETIELQVALTNSGSLTAQNVRAAISAPDHPDNFTGFDITRDYGNLASGTTDSQPFTFALSGFCGDILALELSITTNDDFSRSFPIAIELGELSLRLVEEFDASPEESLPPEWSSNYSGSGSGWSFSTTQSGPGNSASFAETFSSLGTSSLVSPSLTLGPQGGNLRFRHFVATEASFRNSDVGFDGGVLEVSLDGGAWEDIESAGGTFIEGAYNRTLSAAYQNPLPRRRAWSGSLGWINTVVNLPSEFGSRTMRFRWKLGHDTSDSDEGWYLDAIQVTGLTCATTKPIIRLDLNDGFASEFNLTDTAHLTFSPILPLARDLIIPLLTDGNGTPGVDTRAFSPLILPAGDTVLRLEVRPVRDNEVEGPETIRVSLEPDQVFPAGTSSAAITIIDTPYGQWAAQRIGRETPNRQGQDADGDGASNLEEYFWGSDPTSPFSVPLPNPRISGGFLQVDFPLQSLPPSSTIQAQTSTDLSNWTEDNVEPIASGFRVPWDGPARYLRLVYTEAFPR